jgi:glycosidase
MSLYLNPIHAALTNHKYDADDYRAVSPEYGDRDDVRRLAEALHQRGMKLVLDGVFNHMGRSSPKFQAALADENSPYRDWFFFDAELPEGYRGWADVANLPELRMEHPAVREHIYAATPIRWCRAICATGWTGGAWMSPPSWDFAIWAN